MDTETTTEKQVQLETNVTPQMLLELREVLNESLTQFGIRLARAIDPKSEPFNRQYISALEHGKKNFRVTPQIAAAFWNIAAGLDDMPAGVGGAVLVKVLVQPGQVPEGAMIPRTAKAVKCWNPACAVVFVKTHPNQRYHDPECNPRNRKAK